MNYVEQLVNGQNWTKIFSEALIEAIGDVVSDVRARSSDPNRRCSERAN